VTFGDSTADDAYDPTAPPDPVQVARRHREYRQAVEDPPPVAWAALNDDQRAQAVEGIRRLLAWLERSGWDRWERAT
jgi:hypothetical protein